MRVAFLYNRSSEDPAHAVEDAVPARSPVVEALKRLGHRVTPIACTLDLAAARRRLMRAKPDVVFNRVESLGGSDSMAAAIALLLDALQIPYTGNSTPAIVATASKVRVKERLVEAGRNAASGQPVAIYPKTRVIRRDLHLRKAIGQAFGERPVGRHGISV